MHWPTKARTLEMLCQALALSLELYHGVLCARPRFLRERNIYKVDKLVLQTLHYLIKI